MASAEDWSLGYARQADADFRQFQQLLSLEDVPHCHVLQFIQMACEKLVKAHLCRTGAPAAAIQTSHAYVEKTLPVVLRQKLIELQLSDKTARELLKFVKQLAGEIDALTPSVDRDGKRPDNCEYPWEDEKGILHSPLDWSFVPAQLLVLAKGRTFLKLVQAAIRGLLG